uniref:Beta-1,4-galactosyltransferase n=1 Tax=Panagrolaimus davidi TaxID=227884 RepID=A0A914QIW2_9BILA
MDFRNRESHLKILLQNLHPFLEKQQIDYSIFVVEQISNSTFNKAKLMNAGFIEASKMYDWDCFIFHDVDLIPENDQNIYSCPENPRHMSVYVSKFNYELPYSRIMGGVVAISGKHFVETNGYSNSYWGWGGEDDDFYNRIVYGAGFEVTRYSGDEIPKYKSIDHGRDQGNHANPCVFTIMEDTRFRYRCDGLSNCNYKIISSTIKHLYNHFFVDVLEKESRERLHAEKKVYKNC